MRSKRATADLWTKLRPKARELRSAQTLAEQRLWAELRAQKFHGLKFRRQHAIDRFIVDFYCAEAGLAIEVDGEVHRTSIDADAARQARLEQLGLRVIRFDNDRVLNHLDAVLAEIGAFVDDRPTQAPPLHNVERGPGGEVPR